jgi:hypothetical protein
METCLPAGYLLLLHGPSIYPIILHHAPRLLLERHGFIVEWREGEGRQDEEEEEEGVGFC